MTDFTFTKAAMSVAVATVAFSATPSAAQDRDLEAKPYRYVEHYVVDPSKEADWGKSWKAILKEAGSQGYADPMYGYQHRNHRWVVTPMASYAGIDDMLAARKKVYDDGGSAFSRHVDTMMGSVTKNRSYVLKHDADLSYHPEGWMPQTYSRIDTYYYRPNMDDEIKELVAEYRDVMTDLDEPQGFDVYWTTIGSDRPGVMFISSAENPLAMAQHQAETSEREKAESDKMKKMFSRMKQLVVDTETTSATLMPDFSYKASGVDWGESN